MPSNDLRLKLIELKILSHTIGDPLEFKQFVSESSPHSIFVTVCLFQSNCKAEKNICFILRLERNRELRILCSFHSIAGAPCVNCLCCLHSLLRRCSHASKALGMAAISLTKGAGHERPRTIDIICSSVFTAASITTPVRLRPDATASLTLACVLPPLTE